MLLNNAGSQIAFTTVGSNTYAAIIVGQIGLAGLVRKHYILPLSTPVTVFTCPLQSETGGFWTMEDDAMACEPLVLPSKDGDEPLTQTDPHPLHTPTSTQHWG